MRDNFENRFDLLIGLALLFVHLLVFLCELGNLCFPFGGAVFPVRYLLFQNTLRHIKLRQLAVMCRLERLSLALPSDAVHFVDKGLVSSVILRMAHQLGQLTDFGRISALFFGKLAVLA